MMDFVSQVMDFVFKMMDFVSQVMDLVFKMMNEFTCGQGGRMCMSSHCEPVGNPSRPKIISFKCKNHQF